MNELPLYDFFLELRRRERLDLGVDDYGALLQVIQQDLSFVESKDKLMLLCKALWLKPDHNLLTFESLFHTYFSVTPAETKPTEEESKIKREENNDPGSDNFFNDDPAPVDSVHDESSQADQTAQESSELPELATEPDEEPDLGEIYLNIRKHNSSKPATNETEKELTERYNFLFWDEFLPFPRRQLEQQWRFYKKDALEPDKTRLDIRETVQNLAKEPVIFRPAYLNKRVNKARLVILIDHGINMAAFGKLSDVVAETAVDSAGIDVDVFYFQKQPGKVLYRDKAHTEFIKLERFINKYEKESTGLLLISDGGAACQELDLDTLDAFEVFFSKTQKIFNNRVWLNPIPADRWSGTNVELLREWLPVCELTHTGFRQTINLLRGKKGV